MTGRILQLRNPFWLSIKDQGHVTWSIADRLEILDILAD